AHQRVPVVGRGDGDDVDRLVLDDLADVLLVLGRLALGLLDLLHGAADDGLVAVADGGDDAVEAGVEEPVELFGVVAADVAHAAPVGTAPRDAKLFAVAVLFAVFVLLLVGMRGPAAQARQGRRQRRRSL